MKNAPDHMILTMNGNTNKINTASKKKTVKELSNEIDKLKEILKHSKGLISDGMSSLKYRVKTHGEVSSMLF